MTTKNKLNIVLDKMFSLRAKFQKTTIFLFNTWRKKWYRYKALKMRDVQGYPWTPKTVHL